MSEVDTLRWGDTETLTFVPNAGGTALIGPARTKQLAACRWSRPLTWRLLISIVPDMPAVIPAEAGTFAATLFLTIGVGGGLKTIPFFFAVAPTAGVYLPVTTFLSVPAQDIQAQMAVDISKATETETTHAFEMSFFAAPFTEPAGYTDHRDAFLRATGQSLSPGYRDADRQDLPRWMPPGFIPGETRYR